LTIIIGNYQEDPGEAKKKNEGIQCQKGGEDWFSFLFAWPIEPKNLR
jgi:hypothetical protein